MNSNMAQKMAAGMEVSCRGVPNDSFEEGFTACHDLLMPLLIEAMPHVMASHGAEHMMDGFRPQRRPIDDLVERLREVIPDTCRKCGGEMREGVATKQTVTGMPDFPGDTRGYTLSPGGKGGVIPCMKCAKCGWSVTK